jgi:alkyl sulfatase BDS1-like metallo-beta-lactamase superfamily hydrolase
VAALNAVPQEEMMASRFDGVIALASMILVASFVPVSAQESPATQPKPATEATKAANRALASQLNFNDRQDFEDASRGLIAKPDTLTIPDGKRRLGLGAVQDLHRR